MNYNASLISLSYKLIFFVALTLWCFSLHAQADTIPVIPTEEGTLTGSIETVAPRAEYHHSPKKATIMSAALPGLGQIYNKKYWKVPIIYAGAAVTGYYLNDNLRNIEKYKKMYLAKMDGDPTIVYTPQQINQAIEQYKQWRDLSYITFAVIYALNIIDANVDAHLFYFDVSEDISLNWAPYVSPLRAQGAGLTLTFNF